MKMQYKIIRSQRKTLAIEIRNAEIIVRAPLRASEGAVERFVEKHRAWIEQKLRQVKARLDVADAEAPLSEADLRALALRARRVLPERVAYYAERIGVDYGRITVRHQKSKWGSCSAKKNLNFNCLLMLAPPSVQDAIVVHELCHLKEMNHSAAFWREVARVCPDYRVSEAWLKQNGWVLMRRMQNGAQSQEQ